MRRVAIIVLVALIAALAGVAVFASLREDGDDGAAVSPDAQEGGPTVLSVPPVLGGGGTLARAPALAGRDVVSGDPLDLAALGPGPVLVNFWASWCGPCREETPLLATFQKAHPEVRVLGVNLDEASAKAAGFIEEYGIAWPNVADPDQRIYRDWKLFGLPSTFLITNGDTVVGQLSGPLSQAWLDEGLARLAAGA